MWKKRNVLRAGLKKKSNIERVNKGEVDNEKRINVRKCFMSVKERNWNREEKQRAENILRLDGKIEQEYASCRQW